MELIKQLNELIFPSRCLACGVLGESMCATCKAGWKNQLYSTSIFISDSFTLPIISSVAYSQVARRVLLAAKESQIESADRLISEALEHSLRKLMRQRSFDFLIPIPSQKSSVRRRGRQFISYVASGPAEKLSIPIIEILRINRKVKDQSGLSALERWNNLKGAFVVASKETITGRAVLVDDLLTTGATLHEAAHTLRCAGIEVVGAVTAAVALTTKIHSQVRDGA